MGTCLAAGDQVWMLENSIYSILSPEGFASNSLERWKNCTGSSRSDESNGKRICWKWGIVDDVIDEPMPASEANLVELSKDMKNRIRGFLAENLGKEPEKLAEERYERFRKF